MTIQRDRYGRYLIATPGGNLTPYTRTTTISSTLDDTHNLTNWKLRILACGLRDAHDIYARLATTPNDNTRELNQLVQQALDAGGINTAANIGTALHEMTQHHDEGTQQHLPEAWNERIQTYAQTLADNQITILTKHIEQVVVLDDHKIAGTIDRIVRLADGRTLIADLKTGRDLTYSWNNIAIQLAIYAHATHCYNPTTQRRTPMPDVDQTTALVIHLPATEPGCALHLLDIRAGWEAAQLAIAAREWRQTRNLNTPYQPGPTPARRRNELIDRIRQLDQPARKHLANIWPAKIPTFKQTDQHTHNELDQIENIINNTERLHEQPF